MSWSGKENEIKGRVQGSGLSGIELGTREPETSRGKIDLESLLRRAMNGTLKEYDRRADEAIAAKRGIPADFARRQKEEGEFLLRRELEKARSEARDQGLMSLTWFNERADELLDEALRQLDRDLQGLWEPPEL